MRSCWPGGGCSSARWSTRHIPLRLTLPDTCLLTLRDDPRPKIETLRAVFAEVYADRERRINAL